MRHYDEELKESGKTAEQIADGILDSLSNAESWGTFDLLGGGVGIIGGADGPTALIFSKRQEPKVYSACSALHFEPVDDVEWKMVYMVKRYKDISVELIG